MNVPLSLDKDIGGNGRQLTSNRLLPAAFFLLALFACALAAELIVTLLLAVLISLMLAPAVRLLVRWRLPRSVAALLVMCVTISLVGTLLISMLGPARQWLDQVPESVARIEIALRELRQPLVEATQATQGLAELASIDDSGAKPQRVVEVGSNGVAQMLSATPAALAAIVATLLLIFIFLVHGDGLLRKCVELAPQLSMKKDIVLATRSVQHELSVYMLAITLINAALGLLTAVGLWWLGVEQPLLWGTVAALLNYAPYVGPLMTMVALTVVGFTTFHAPLAALGVPGLFLVLHIIEGQFFTPLVVGRRMALDPVIVFVALVVFGWLWGMAGLLMALPLLTCVRIVAERVPEWRVLAKILGV